MLRLMLNHGIIDSIPWIIASLIPTDVIHDVLRLVLAHPQSLPKDEIAAELWSWVRLSPCWDLTKTWRNSMKTFPQLIDEEAQFFESTFRMLGLDANARHQYGRTVLHEFCYYNCDPEEPRLSRFRSLLRLGADPCLLDARGGSPMLYALSNRRHIKFCKVMAEMGLDVNAIAKHTYRESAYASNNLFKIDFPNVSRPEMLQLFSEAGIYPDDSWFDDEASNIYSLKASTVDFVPATIHEQSRNTSNTIRKRSARAVCDEP